ncbi:RNA-directed DNA polymerase, eukaryota [Tanacetum coccineum]
MTWHTTGKCTEPGKMQHAVNGRAWKNFDTKYPDFAKEPRNVRLGLAANGFNLLSTLDQLTAYSMIIDNIHLPPWSGPPGDGQSTDVDAPPDIIDVEEDDDIIDDEDAFPHDLADSNDKDLVNVDDDDDVAVVYSSEKRTTTTTIHVNMFRVCAV